MVDEERMVRDANVFAEKPMVRGTSMSGTDIRQSDPRLTPEHMRACVAYAKAALQREHSSAA